MELQGTRLSFYGEGLATYPTMTEETLARIETLDLNGNRFTSLPPWLPSMRKLRTIYGGGNLISELPGLTSGDLPQLRTVCLDRNNIRDIPESWSTLKLELLDLSDNQIVTIPRAFAVSLRSGLTLRLNHNPLTDPIGTINARGAIALAHYLDSLTDAVKLYEARALLVGEGAVGKSSLVASFHNESFIKGRATTHGIEISQLMFPLAQAEIRLSLWDFGGQEVYRVTHQFFFSPRVLYLVVWNTREGPVKNDVDGWVERITIRAGFNVRIIIVATCGDERRPEFDYPRLQRKYGDVLSGSIVVDNASGNGIPTLMDRIRGVAASLPQMGQVISNSWHLAKVEICELAASKPYLRYEEFEGICLKNGVDASEVPTLATLLHDLGDIVYFGDDLSLTDIVVLDPEWLTKAIGLVLEDAETRSQGGILMHAHLDQVWANPKSPSTYDRRFFPYFLRLMERFDVSYRIQEAEASLVAQLTPWDRPALPWDFDTPCPTGTGRIRLSCRMASEPPGLIAWMTVRYHAASVGLHWRRGVFLRHPRDIYDSEALLELDDDGILHIEVRAPSPDFFFSTIRDGLDFLLSWRWPGLQYQFTVPCLTRSSAGDCEGLLPLAGLLTLWNRGQRDPVPCYECGEYLDLGVLLTGHAGQPHGDLTSALKSLNRTVADVSEGVRRVEALAGDAALQVRRVVAAASKEVSDCPRLFTVRTAGRRVSAMSTTVIVQLWCEHPGAWHPVDNGHYKWRVPRDWLVRLSPYLRLVSRTLSVVVPGANLVDFVLPAEAAQTVLSDISATGKLIDAVGNPARSVIADKYAAHGRVGPAEGEGLRAFRSELFKRDPGHWFGGLRRVLTESGDYLWLCPDHYGEYDPGLPVLPQ